MDRNTAQEIMQELLGSSHVINMALLDVKDSFPEEPFRATKLMLGYFMSDMFDMLLAPIYDQHPNLAPDWYEKRAMEWEAETPHLKLPSAIQRATLAAFEDAYARVQSAASKVSQLSDPFEVAMLSDGLHRISARLCRARLALLRAEVY